MKECSKEIISMAKEHYTHKMESRYMKEILKIINSVEEEHYMTRMET